MSSVETDSNGFHTSPLVLPLDNRLSGGLANAPPGVYVDADPYAPHFLIPALQSWTGPRHDLPVILGLVLPSTNDATRASQGRKEGKPIVRAFSIISRWPSSIARP